MKIGILGTGAVGETIGSKLITLGHEVKMGSRSATNEKALAFVAKHPGGKASAGTFAEAATFGELIFNCTKGDASIEALRLAGEGLRGKVLADVSNPLDFSKGMPPFLIPHLSNTHSLGEEIQKQFPETRVVKTLNTIWCGLMVDPHMIGAGNHVNFICGNDEGAKAEVAALLKTWGWKDECLVDLGGIAAARGMEAMILTWLNLWGKFQTAAFNYTIVK